MKTFFVYMTWCKFRKRQQGSEFVVECQWPHFFSLKHSLCGLPHNNCLPPFNSKTDHIIPLKPHIYLLLEKIGFVLSTILLGNNPHGNCGTYFKASVFRTGLYLHVEDFSYKWIWQVLPCSDKVLSVSWVFFYICQ